MVKENMIVKKVKTLRGRATVGLRKDAYMSLEAYSYMSLAPYHSFGTCMVLNERKKARERVCFIKRVMEESETEMRRDAAHPQQHVEALTEDILKDDKNCAITS